MKKSVYLDTTIFSYYFDERSSLKIHIDRTKKWWDKERNLYDLYVSAFVLFELQEWMFPRQKEAIKLARSTYILEATKEINEIVDYYIKNHLMPSRDIGDAVHLAYASFYKIDALLTWNCSHLANINKKGHIKNINQSIGLFVPEIVTPLELRTN